MARALCTNCGKDFHWYGGKGRRLATIASPCCAAAAKAPARKQSIRTASPTVMAIIRVPAPLSHHGERWIETQRCAVRLYPDGRVQCGKWYRICRPTETISDGWRLFEWAGKAPDAAQRAPAANEVGGYSYARDHYRALIREEDWRHLLAKAGEACSDDDDG
jgi:hypothetical protein